MADCSLHAGRVRAEHIADFAISLGSGLAVRPPSFRETLGRNLVTLPLCFRPVATGLLLLKFFSLRSGVGHFLHRTSGD